MSQPRPQETRQCPERALPSQHGRTGDLGCILQHTDAQRGQPSSSSQSEIALAGPVTETAPGKHRPQTASPGEKAEPALRRLIGDSPGLEKSARLRRRANSLSSKGAPGDGRPNPLRDAEAAALLAERDCTVKPPAPRPEACRDSFRLCFP